MSDSPHLIPETSASPPPPNQKDFSSSCPFCVIAANYQPISPHSAVSSSSTSVAELDPEKVDPASFVLFSSEHVIAFLDILPLTAGHVLVAPRKHRVKVGDLSPDESAEVRFSSPCPFSFSDIVSPIPSKSGWRGTSPDKTSNQSRERYTYL